MSNECLGCGCADSNACVVNGVACHWLAIDHVLGVGVCSNCKAALPVLARMQAEMQQIAGSGVIEMLQITAKKWRELNPEYLDGVVLIWQGSAYGWKNCLRDPAHEQPGAFAVDVGGNVHFAVGGNSYDGAKCWVAFTLENADG